MRVGFPLAWGIAPWFLALFLVTRGAGAQAGGAPEATAGAGVSEAPAQGFYSRGRVILTGNIGGAWSNDDAPMSSLGKYYRWHLAMTPGAIFFPSPRVGLGAFVGFQLGAAESPPIRVRRSGMVAGARVAFPLILSQSTSLMPWIWGGYRRETVDHRGEVTVGPGLVIDYPADRLQLVATGLLLPLLWHPSSSVAIGGGPAFTAEFFLRDRESNYPLDSPRFIVGLASEILVSL